MFRKIMKLIGNPRKYFLLLIQTSQQLLCRLFKGTAFFMQGQMDINPKSRWHNPEFVKQTGGYFPRKNETKRVICDLEPWDTTRKDMLILFLRTIIEKNIEGDFVELGVYKGNTSKLIHYYAPERKLHLFDTFEGFGERSAITEKNMSGKKILESQFSDTSLNEVKDYISPLNQNISFHKGYFPDSIPTGFHQLRFAFVHLDADLYEPIFEGLKFFYPKMSKHGFIIVHDFNAWAGARKAVEDFFDGKAEIPVPMPDKSGSVLIMKQ